ncbi:hypothetical protein F5050DRAFT_1710849 [Lentinula boryana]|uniref:Uncharacterized protein n=1 Tax=Lentinula boryana TaxID=40481 RepID=A0ABQ8QHP7_9AGAR|nr:hypothetical protein F5050DRAFT_1710849 [Lentinula boryana]
MTTFDGIRAPILEYLNGRQTFGRNELYCSLCSQIVLCTMEDYGLSQTMDHGLRKREPARTVYCKGGASESLMDGVYNQLETVYEAIRPYGSGDLIGFLIYIASLHRPIVPKKIIIIFFYWTGLGMISGLSGLSGSTLNNDDDDDEDDDEDEDDHNTYTALF